MPEGQIIMSKSAQLPKKGNMSNDLPGSDGRRTFAFFGGRVRRTNLGVVSFAPFMALAGILSSTTAFSFGSMIASSLVAGEALAQCTTSGSSATCSGTITGKQTITSTGSITVNIDGSATLTNNATGNAGHALEVTATTGVTIIQASPGGEIKAGTGGNFATANKSHGIKAVSSSGAVNVTTTGKIQGRGVGGNAIYLKASGDITLSSTGILETTHQSGGRVVGLYGSGNISATLGEVRTNHTTSGQQGVKIETSTAGKNINLTVTTINARRTNLEIKNSTSAAGGTGSVTVSAGTLSGRSGVTSTLRNYGSGTATITVSSLTHAGTTAGFNIPQLNGDANVTISTITLANNALGGNGSQGIRIGELVTNYLPSNLTYLKTSGTISVTAQTINASTNADFIGIPGGITARGKNATFDIDIRNINATGTGARIRGKNVSFTSTGTIIAGSSGINIYNTADSVSVAPTQNITVSAATVSAGNEAIRVHNVHSNTANGPLGFVNITTTGVISSTNSAAITVRHSGTNVIINTSANVTGSTSGIFVRGYGTGFVNLSTSATVTGSGNAIYVHNKGTTVTITAATLTGSTGLYVKNAGSGIATITVSNATTTNSAQTGKGAVYVYSKAGASVNVRSATGGRLVDIRNSSAGTVSLTSTGTLNAPLPVFVKNTASTKATVTLSTVITTASGTTAIGAAYVYSKGGTDVTIGTVTGINRALVVKNSGTGVAEVTVSTATVTVPGTPTYSSIGAVYVYSKGGTDVKVNTSATAIDHAVVVVNSGAGNAKVTVANAVVDNSGAVAVDVTSNAGAEVDVAAATGKRLIKVSNSTSGDVTVTSTGTLGTAFLNSTPVEIKNSGNGTTTVTLNNVSGGSVASAALYVYSKAGSDVTVSSVTGSAKAVRVINSGTGIAKVNVTSATINQSGTNAKVVEVYSKGGTDVTVSTATGHNLVDIRNVTTGTVSFTSSGTLTAAGQPVYIRNTGNSSADLSISSVTSTNSASTAKGAVYVYSKGGITGSIRNATGATLGVSLNNSGVGAISITSVGTITASGQLGVSNSGQHAITVRNRATTGTDITVSANTVNGFISGIYAINNGSGAVSISALGAVTGSNGSAIYVKNSGTSVTVNTSVAVNGRDGIVVNNNGNDLVTVEAEETISATGATPAAKGALYIRSKGGITATTAVVSGAKSAINIKNVGVGSIAFNATGTITSSANQSGIVVENGTSSISTGVNVSITAAAVSGSAAGIFTQNYGTGNVNIRTNGIVTGVSGHGIFAKNENGGSATVTTILGVTGSGTSADGLHITNDASGTGITVSASAAVDGGRKGIYTKNAGGGGTSITVSGKLTATISTGIHAIDNGAGTLTISSTSSEGLTSTGHIGIRAQKTGTGNLTISVSGPITALQGINTTNANSDTSITALGGIIGGNSNSIFANGGNSGALSIETSGTVSASRGLHAETRGTNLTVAVENVISQSSGRDAITARNYGNGFTRVTVTGTVTGGGKGIEIVARGGDSVFVTTEGTVSGATSGVTVQMANTGSADIRLSGNVTGSANDGVYVTGTSSGTSISVNASGSISGGNRGVDVTNSGGGAVTIIASGSVTGSNQFGIRARNYSGGGITVSTQGDVTGGLNGMTTINKGDVATNITISGNVISQNGHGLVLTDESNQGATVNITGTITASGTDATTSIASDGVVINLKGGALSFIASNAILGPGDGIVFRNTDRSGDQTFNIGGAVTGSAGHGISISNESSGDFSITASGNISGGGGHGVQATISSVSTVTVKSLGEIQANGPNFDGVNVVTEGGATLDLTTSGGVIAQEGSGIVLRSTGTGDVSVTVSTGSSGVIGSIGIGIDVENEGGGSVTIDAKSLVEGRRSRTGANNLTVNNEGILVTNDVSGASVTITATSVTASGHAINATNFGVGATSVSTTGVILGGEDGIRALAGSESATTLIINASGAVTGSAGSGIHVQSKGSGAVTITTTGAVTGGTRDGVYALSDSSGITVNVNSVRGGQDGVEAYSKAGGSVSVVASSSIIGRTRNGIRAIASGETIDVTATSVSGGVTGVEVKNKGIGAVTINLSQVVRGLGMDGIYAYNSASGTDLTILASGNVTGGSDGVEADKANGKSDGIQVINLGSGTTSVTARGSITGGNHGVSLSSSGTGLTLIAGAVSSKNNGVKVENLGSSATSLTFTGSITGTDGNGVSATTGDKTTDLLLVTRAINVGGDGINISHSGANATVTVSGNISAAANGLILDSKSASGTTTVSVTGNIVAGTDGMKVTTISDGNISIRNIGGINSSGTAFHVMTSGNGNITVDFSGAVTATGSGFHIAGTSSATTESGNNITFSSVGGIQATNTALHVSNSGESGTTTVTVSGSLVSSSSHGIVAMTRGKNISVTASGGVTAGKNAVYVNNSGTGTTVLVASGAVNGGEGGIVIKGSSSSLGITVTAEEALVGGAVGLHIDHKGTGAVTFTAKAGVTGVGNVADANKNAVDVYLGSSAASATLTLVGITGSGDGVKLQNKGSGTTSIVATGTILGNTGFGVNVYGNSGAITISTKNVTGVQGGINVEAKTGAITITADDVVGSNANGITVSANGGGLTSVTLSGSVTGLINGIDVRRGDNTSSAVGVSNDINIVTTDDVTGQGVAATENNAAQPGAGIFARHNGSGNININISNGSVQGGNGGLPIDADAVNGVTNINLNSGAIIGQPGSDAILHSAGGSVVTVNIGSDIRGNVKLGGGSDELKLQGGVINSAAVLDGGTDAGINRSVDIVTFSAPEGVRVAKTEINGANLINWERIIISSKAEMIVKDTQSLATAELTNLGVINMVDGVPDDVLEIKGNYVGGGFLQIDVNFATQQTDRLTIDGDVIGVTELVINDVTSGSLATGRQFAIVSVEGNVSPCVRTRTKCAFNLDRAKRVDGFDYDLVFDDSNNVFILTVGIGNPLDIDTMLVATPAALTRTFAHAPSMMQRRQGLLPWTNEGETQDGTWMRYFGATNDHGLVGTGGSFQSDQTVFQYGYDLLAFDFGNGGWSVGITAQTGSVTANAEGAGGVGTIESKGYGIGTTATWFGRDGSYFDIQGQVNFVETEFANIRHGNLTEAQKTEAWVASMELGRRMHMGGGLSIIPQGQLSVGQIAGNEFETDRGNKLGYDSHLSLNARFGVAAEYFGDRSRGYVVGNFLHNFSDTWEVQVDQVSVNDKISPSSIEFGIGGSVASTDSTTLFIEASYRLGVGGEEGSQESSAMLATGIQWSW